MNNWNNVIAMKWNLHQRRCGGTMEIASNSLFTAAEAGNWMTNSAVGVFCHWRRNDTCQTTPDTTSNIEQCNYVSTAHDETLIRLCFEAALCRFCDDVPFGCAPKSEIWTEYVCLSVTLRRPSIYVSWRNQCSTDDFVANFRQLTCLKFISAYWSLCVRSENHDG
jgi:hypothetical protein